MATKPSKKAKLPLIVVGDGHNDRIGNFLPLYARLRDLSKKKHRALHFPFAEDRISRIFDFVNDLPSETGNGLKNQVLYKRIIRAAEEQLEAEQGVGPFAYEVNTVHFRDYPELSIRVVFARGPEIAWEQFIAGGGLDTEYAVIWKDPFPLAYIQPNADLAVEMLKNDLRIKPDLLKTAKEDQAKSRSDQGDCLDICFHWRQGDFKNWAGGRFWYDEATMTSVVGAIRAFMAERNLNAEITILSDGEIPDSFVQGCDVKVFQRSMPEDFVRLTCADIVLANRSTFSQVAVGVGKALLGSNAEYISLNEAVQSVQNVDLYLSRLFK